MTPGLRLANAILFIAAVTSLPGCYRDPERLRAFAEHHEKIQGRIKHLDCGNHGAVYYEFDVGGQNQAGQAALGTVDCRSSKVGAPITVYYYPADPRTHSTFEPSVLYAQEKGYYLPAWGWFLLVFPTYLVVVTVISLAQNTSRPKSDDA